MAKKIHEPITAACKECGKEFVITPEEQSYMKMMGYELPKRCAQCREIRKQARKAEAARLNAEREKAKAVQREKKLEQDEKKLLAFIEDMPFAHAKLEELELQEPKDTLVVIGNGFDIMHGAKSSFWDFSQTIGKNSSLRWELETYLDVKYDELWSDLEGSLGKLKYDMFITPDIIDMWLDNFDAYNIDAQAADYYAAVESAIAPTFSIPSELESRLKKWVKSLSINENYRPLRFLQGNFKVLCFNYTEFVEVLYGAVDENICYIHGCRMRRQSAKNGKLILGHESGIEDEQWDKVDCKPFRYKDPYKRALMERAIDTALDEAAWYDELTTKNCSEIIKQHQGFFTKLKDIKEVYVIGHSLFRVDYPYFKEISEQCRAKWYIGFHSYDDMMRLVKFVDEIGLEDITVFRT